MTGIRLAALLLPAIAIGCAQSPTSSATPEPPQLAAGEDYGIARRKMLDAGWRPIPARCAVDNLCFGDTPELATNLSSRKTCGEFASGRSAIRICVDVIPDGAYVDRIERLD